jgi:tripartite-type tricarboxylate transporter receptor subunit TctC
MSILARMILVYIVTAPWLGTAGAQTQTTDFPNRPIRVLVPYGPGGVDYQIRALAPALGNILGQQIVVENREGGGAIIGTAAVKSAPPDGYTLLFTGTAALSVVPHLRKTPYAIDDFEPIGNVTATPLIVTARGNAPFRTLPELLTFAKANPGKVNMGSAGSGTSTHIVGEAFQAAAGIKFTHVPFRGVGAATNAMLSGDVDLVIGVPGVMVPHFATGKLIALASTGKARSEFAPDVPSLFETGLDVVEETKFGLLAPRGTPEPVLRRLTDALAKAATALEFVDLMRKTFATQAYLTPAQFRAAIGVEDAYWTKLLKDPRFSDLIQ